MYSNIGKKIMTLAVILAIVMMIGSFGYGIYRTVNNNTTVGALTMVFGPILSWIAGFFLYGYGRLIDNSDYIARKLGRRDGFGIPDVSDKLDWGDTGDDEREDEPPAAPKFIAQRVVSQPNTSFSEKKQAVTPAEPLVLPDDSEKEFSDATVSFCPSCGNKTENSPDFCSKCGHKLK